MDSPNVVFQFCPEAEESLATSTAGIQAFYATDPQTVQQIKWIYGSSQWIQRGPFTANGHAGVACYTWGPDSVLYRLHVNLNNEVNVMWMDRSTTVAANVTHPINTWTNTSVSIPGVLPITNLSFNTYLVAQMPDGSLIGNNITFDAENTLLDPNQHVTFVSKALAGTHLWLWDLPTASGDPQLTLFHQLNGSDITLTMRDMLTGQSVTKGLPILDS
jgi:hypothetical protein